MLGVRARVRFERLVVAAGRRRPLFGWQVVLRSDWMGCWPLQRAAADYRSPRDKALGRRETDPPTKLRKKKKLEQLKVFYSGELNGYNATWISR